MVNGTEIEEEFSSAVWNMDEGEGGETGGESEGEEREVEGFSMNLEGRGPEVVVVTYMILPDDLEASTMCFWVNLYHFHPFSVVLSDAAVQVFSEYTTSGLFITSYFRTHCCLARRRSFIIVLISLIISI